MPEIFECSIKNENQRLLFWAVFHNFRKKTSLMTTPCYRPHVLCIARLKPWKTQIWKKRGRSALLTFMLRIFWNIFFNLGILEAAINFKQNVATVHKLVQIVPIRRKMKTNRLFSTQQVVRYFASNQCNYCKKVSALDAMYSVCTDAIHIIVNFCKLQAVSLLIYY